MVKEGFHDLQAVFAILVERDGIVIVQDSHASAQKTNMRFCNRLPHLSTLVSHLFERESDHNEKGSIYNQRK